MTLSIYIVILLSISTIKAYDYDSDGNSWDDYSENRYQHNYYEQFKHDQKITDDYLIYDLIDRMTSLTDYSTFYELLKIDPASSIKEISSSFRGISKEWHPDKNRKDSNAHEKFALLSGIASVLKNVESRERYDWILNESPIWHKSGYYVHKYMTGKLSIYQVLIIVVLVITSIQIFKQFGIWCFAKYRKLKALSRLKQMGKNEFKSLKRRMEKLGNEVTDIQLLQSSDIETWILATSTVEPPHLIERVFLFRVIFIIYQYTTGNIINRILIHKRNK